MTVGLGVNTVRLPTRRTGWAGFTHFLPSMPGSKRENMSNIGFIGLGIMGNAMSRNLLKAGHSLVVYDVVPQLVDRVVAGGATPGASCQDVASRSDVVITMLPDGPEVEQAMLGPRRCC